MADATFANYQEVIPFLLANPDKTAEHWGRTYDHRDALLVIGADRAKKMGLWDVYRRKVLGIVKATDQNG